MHGYVKRIAESALRRAAARSPVVAILGPRQCGKSTLAREWLAGRKAVYLDLQSRVDRAKLAEPELFLESHRDELVCLDEIQLVPDFFSVLRSEIDADRRNGRFLVLGSASRDLLRQSTETLAGRIALLDLTPFLHCEVAADVGWQSLWLRGGFPESTLSPDDRASYEWRIDFVRTFLERDIPALGMLIPIPAIDRLWRLLAHYHGSVVNFSKLAGAADLSVPTLRKYLGILEQAYMIRLLPPFAANLKKRLVRSAKMYLRDSGVLHALLDIETYDSLLAHPANGESWEGHVIENIVAQMPHWRASFLRTSNGAEVDLVMERGDRLRLFECKLSKSPKPSRGFHELVRDLEPESATVVAPVDEPFDLSGGVRVAPLGQAVRR